MDAPLHGSFMTPSMAVSLVWFEVVSATSGASEQGVMGVYGRVFAWPFQ
jgi:hypothetical protein